MKIKKKKLSSALFQWSGRDANHFFLLGLRPDQFNFRKHGFFSKFAGSVGRKKKENKKNAQFFALALIINKSFL